MRQDEKSLPTADELVAMLRHSSLPTLVVEGQDDVVAFRCLEERFRTIQLSVLDVGGRATLLAIYDRKGELPNNSVAFIADRDTWVYNEIPEHYNSPALAFSSGYSIENDIFIDGEIESLMSDEERRRFQFELEKFTEWFALAIQRFLNGSDQRLDLHPNHVLDSTDFNLYELHQGEAYPSDMRRRIAENYQKLIRGKSLLDLALRQLSYKGRPARHHHLSLIETTAARPGVLLQRLHRHIGEAFASRIVQQELV